MQKIGDQSTTGPCMQCMLMLIHQILSLARDWSKRVTWANTGEYPRIFPNFQNCSRCVEYLKDNKDNSLHLGRKYARIFVLGHHLFLVAHSFPRATLSENCSLLGTDNVRGQYPSIFSRQMEAIVYITLHTATASAVRAAVKT